MKHIKKFNEELSPHIYKNAAFKLKKMGHDRRANELEQYGETTSKRQETIKWKKNIDEYSKYGKIRLKFKVNKYNKNEYEGDFYFQLEFDDYVALESIGYAIENSKGYFDFSISFSVGIIPADEETKKICEQNMPEPEFSNGFFWGLWVYINYKVEDEKIQFSGISYSSYDQTLSGEPELADRKSAMTFKNVLKYCFDENSNYPSSHTSNPDMYDILFKKLCQELELLPNYNLSMDRILSDIKSFTVNKLYKE